MLKQLNIGSPIGGAAVRWPAAVVITMSVALASSHVGAQSPDAPELDQMYVNIGLINLQEVMEAVGTDEEYADGKSFQEPAVSRDGANLIYEVIVHLKDQYELLWIYDEHSGIFFDPLVALKDPTAYMYTVLTQDQALELCALALQSTSLSSGDHGGDRGEAGEEKGDVTGDVSILISDKGPAVRRTAVELEDLLECRGKLINITADVLVTLAALTPHEQP